MDHLLCGQLEQLVSILGAERKCEHLLMERRLGSRESGDRGGTVVISIWAMHVLRHLELVFAFLHVRRELLLQG